uniref:Uncharacterized protein n=1 Tax=Calidris pygmaea TaxID=425635 RepID=A0A8C3KB25_9CHAR
MATRTPEEILRDEACCSICLEIFQDPVSIHCGHSFCQSCITGIWEGLTTNFSCPQCRQMVSQKSLRPNRELANMIEAGLNLQPVGVVEGGENLCEEHQEPLKLFCKDEERLICVVCDKSKVHRDHYVVSVGEAAQEYKVRGLWACSGTKVQMLLVLLPLMGGDPCTAFGLWDKPPVDSPILIVMTFRQLHEFLEKQESSLLAQLDTEMMNAHEEMLQRLLEETTEELRPEQ